MKTKLVFLLLSLFNVQLSAQQKGASPIIVSSGQLSVNSNTYAVVVGISDYQDNAIPDLRFADKDAEAFANYLRSPVFANGAGLDEDHLRLLTNQKATAGQVAAALDWLLEQAKEGDRAIIYFSGHGDVERKTVSQPGFLLCWDSPAKVYMGGGTYSLAYLQEIVTTLSTVNLAKVFVISDACHAGKLAGSQIGGAQLTTANLAKQFSNELKILSCQPGEFSLEGEQWGGGRGCFSYHLVEGLYGMADRNQDLVVSLGEIDRYLEDYVTAEAAPLSQVPVVLGSKIEKLANVSPQVLASLQKSKRMGETNLVLFAATEGRGLEDVILSKQDSNLQKKYYAFQKAILEKRFFEPEHNCADNYYNELISQTAISALHGLMKRNYAAALQDDAQQTLNKYMGAEMEEISLSFKSKVEKYKAFPKQLARAAELLGEKHYLYRAIKARQAYFEGFPLTYSGDFKKASMDKAISHFQEALTWQPDMPLALLGLQWIYGYFYLNLDSAAYFAHKAYEIAPAWVIPFVRMSAMYSQGGVLMEKAKEYIEFAEKIDSGSAFILEAKAEYYYAMKDYKSTEITLNKLISLQKSPTCLPCARDLLVLTYVVTGRLNEALVLAKQLTEDDPTHSSLQLSLGKIYVHLGQRDNANACFKKLADLSVLYSHHDAIYYYWMAFADAFEGKTEKAFESLERSLKAGMDDYNWMQQDPDMELLRNHKAQWDHLMQKYFPQHSKESGK